MPAVMPCAYAIVPLMSDPEHIGPAGGGRPAHSRKPMTGRDPEEPGRSATPLEPLFDLTFVVAVGAAASRFAEMLAEDHTLEAVGAFTPAMLAPFVTVAGYETVGHRHQRRMPRDLGAG
ncbi:hypothetical protein RKD28_000398 [Streptomyces sp. SAI-229]|jgi:hypothetical protein